MLDLGIIANVVIGVFAYKAIIALMEFACLKIIATLLGKQIQGSTREERRRKAINLANEELKNATLN